MAHVEPPVIAWERWVSMWPEAEVLAAAHFAEVEGDLAKQRPFGVRADVMEQLNELGVLRIVTARVAGRLVGYCTWNVSPDIESFGTLKADQGAIYVDPEFRGLGYAMVKFGFVALRESGVEYVFMHHRMLGRGAGLRVWFERLGATLIQHTYFLWIGD